MTVTLELPEDVLADLRAEADRRGLTIEAVATERLRARRLSFIGIGASGGEWHARDSEEELRAKGFGQH